ncbi:hypothetical protein GmHk_13G038705 [Glycine max]|nr:hypothetical protein GmHk_13G038705 [Glycine max]
MTIILDDVSSLLHFPITCTLPTHSTTTFNNEHIKALWRSKLHIMTNQEVDVAISTRPEVALAWLEELYDNYVDFGSYFQDFDNDRDEYHNDHSELN